MLDTPARGLSSLTPVPSITCPAFFPTCTLLLSSVGTRSARKTQSPSKASRAMSLQGRSLATQGPQLAPAFARIRAPKLRASPAEHNAGSSSSNSKDVVVEELSYRCAPCCLHVGSSCKSLLSPIRDSLRSTCMRVQPTNEPPTHQPAAQAKCRGVHCQQPGPGVGRAALRRRAGHLADAAG